MKFSHYKGFTLVELMIVIAIIGILIVAMQRFSASPAIYQERATRLAEMIYDTIRDTRQDMITGKMYDDIWNIWNNSQWVSTVKIIRIMYSWWWDNQISIEEDTAQDTKIPIAFDGDIYYRIEKIDVLRKDETNWTEVESIELQFARKINGTWRAVLKNTNRFINDFTDYRITVDYKWFKRYIIGNVLTGNAEIKTQP